MLLVVKLKNSLILSSSFNFTWNPKYKYCWHIEITPSCVSPKDAYFFFVNIYYNYLLLLHFRSIDFHLLHVRNVPISKLVHSIKRPNIPGIPNLRYRFQSKKHSRDQPCFLN